MFKWYNVHADLKETREVCYDNFRMKRAHCTYYRRQKRKSRRVATASRRRGDSAETGVASTLLASMDNNSTISTPNDSFSEAMAEASPLNDATNDQQGNSAATIHGKCAQCLKFNQLRVHV